MLVEELLVFIRGIQQAPLRDVQVAERTNVARVRARGLSQQIAPVPEQKLDLVACGRQFVLVGDVLRHLLHRFLHPVIQRREIAPLLLDTHLRKPDVRERLASFTHLRAILRDLREIPALFDEQPANRLGNTADLQPLLRTCQVLLDLACLFLDGRQFIRDAFRLGRDWRQLANQFRVALGEALDHGVFAGRCQLDEYRLLQRLLRAALPCVIYGGLQHLGLTSQPGQGAGRHIALRTCQFQPCAIAQDFLVEPVQFGLARLERQCRHQLACIVQDRRFAGRQAGFDGSRQFVHAVA